MRKPMCWILILAGCGVSSSSCIVAMIYTGGFFDGASFVDAFAASDASVGLVLGGAVALVFTFIYYHDA